MSIIASQNGRNAKIVNPSRFDNEDSRGSCKRGRPAKGEKREPIKLKCLDRQSQQSLEDAIKELPTVQCFGNICLLT